MSFTIKAFETENIMWTSAQKSKCTNIFGGNLNVENDPIAQRRKEAQEKAWDIVKNALHNDNDVDHMIQSRKEHYAEMETKKIEALEGFANVQKEKEELEELCQDKENEEYQSRVAELNQQADELKKQIDDADQRMRNDTAVIYGIQKERLKTNPMMEAQRAAGDILESAKDEIVGMLMEDSQEYMEKKLEESKEAAKESMKEKEEREEQLKELKLKKAVQEALVEGTKEAIEKAKVIEHKTNTPDIGTMEMTDIMQGSDMMKDISQSLEEVKSSMKLLEADLKGIRVDEKL